MGDQSSLLTGNSGLPVFSSLARAQKHYLRVHTDCKAFPAGDDSFWHQYFASEFFYLFEAFIYLRNSNIAHYSLVYRFSFLESSSGSGSHSSPQFQSCSNPLFPEAQTSSQIILRKNFFALSELSVGISK